VQQTDDISGRLMLTDVAFLSRFLIEQNADPPDMVDLFPSSISAISLRHLFSS
jgi:hypothetical protein